MLSKGVLSPMPKIKLKPKAEKEVVRVAFRFHGAELLQIREVRDMVSLNSELDAVRYLMQRGLEAISGQLGTRRLTTKLMDTMTPERMLTAVLSGSGLELNLEAVKADLAQVAAKK